MTRFAFFLLADALLFLAAAPVPKQPPAPPPELTRVALEGHWEYDYAGMLGGHITFFGDGTYEACHVPGSTTIYFGSYSLTGNSVTLYESCRIAGDDAPASWVGTFTFDFDKTKPPKLVGKSNGVTDVKLSRRVF